MSGLAWEQAGIRWTCLVCNPNVSGGPCEWPTEIAYKLYGSFSEVYPKGYSFGKQRTLKDNQK